MTVLPDRAGAVLPAAAGAVLPDRAGSVLPDRAGAVLPALVGVDIAEVSRVARAVADHGEHYPRRVMTPAERRLHGVGEVAVTATVAMKECLIKAVGGRPPGFDWHDFDGAGGRFDGADPSSRPEDVPDPVTDLLDEAAQRLRVTTDLSLTNEVVHDIGGVSRRAAQARLATDGVTEPQVVGVARWGRHGDAVVALALVIVDYRGVR